MGQISNIDQMAHEAVEAIRRMSKGLPDDTRKLVFAEIAKQLAPRKTPKPKVERPASAIEATGDTAMTHPLLTAFQAADDAWSRELQAAFDKRAGDVRYTAAGHGEAGTPLRAAYDARKAASDAWHVRRQHGGNPWV